MARFQFAYLPNNFYAFIDDSRSIEFLYRGFRSLHQDNEDAFKTSRLSIIDPNLETFKFILGYNDTDIRESLWNLYEGIITQVPEECGVFTVDKTKFSMFLAVHDSDTEFLTSSGFLARTKLKELLWSKYLYYEDDELIKLIYDSIYAIAENISSACFDNCVEE